MNESLLYGHQMLHRAGQFRAHLRDLPNDQGCKTKTAPPDAAGLAGVVQSFRL